MRNVIINWVLPTTRKLGGPLPESEIQHVVIEMSADAGASYSLIGDFPPAELSVPVNDLPFSDQYVVRGTVVDTDLQPGNSVTQSFVVSDTSPPGDLVITIEFP